MHPELSELLHRRIAVIADHAWRDSDPAAHLEALKDVSMRITEWTTVHRPELDPKLKHYLANSSYHKALDHLEGRAS